MQRRKRQSGFTVAELLVSLSLFGIVGVGISSFMMDTMKRASLENRISTAAQEVENAFHLISSELRLSSQISPYLPGTNVSLTTCGSALSVTSTNLRFLVAHDDALGTNGLNRYYVGYRFDSTLKQLIRGELASSGATACSVPSGDPADSSNGAVIARNVVQVDANGDGSLDPVFSLNGDLVTVTVGVQVTLKSGFTTTQNISSEVLLRSR